MKKLTLLLIALIWVFNVSEAQNVFDPASPNGTKMEETVVKTPGGTYILAKPIVPDGLTEIVRKQQNINGDENYCSVTMRFASPYSYPPSVQLFNETNFYATDVAVYTDCNPSVSYDENLEQTVVTWDEVAEGNYHLVMASYHDGLFGFEAFSNEVKYVFSELNLTGNLDTLMNFDEAVHKVSLLAFDENNQRFENDDEENFFQITFLKVRYPDGMDVRSNEYLAFPFTYNGSVYFGGDTACVYISDVSNEYKLNFSQVIGKIGKLYAYDFPEINNGLSSDSIITKNASYAQPSPLVLGKEPMPGSEGQPRYLTFNAHSIGYHPERYYSYQDAGGTIQLSYYANNYPIGQDDTLKIFCGNSVKYNSSTNADALYWEGNPIDNFSGCTKVGPFIKHIYYTPIAEPEVMNFNYKQLGTNFDGITNETPFYGTDMVNNIFSQEDIDYLEFYWGTGIGKQAQGDVLFRSRSYMESYYTNFELRDQDGELLREGPLSGWFPFEYQNEGLYTLSLSNEHYRIKDITGNIKNILEFDVSKEDANPPVMNNFRILNTQGMIKFDNAFEEGENGTLLFEVFDRGQNRDNYRHRLEIEEDSIKAYYKNSSSEEWIEIQVNYDMGLSDTLWGNWPPEHTGVKYMPNRYYSGSLKDMFAEAGYKDLKITLTDASGNRNTQIWHPALYVVGDSVSLLYENWDTGDFSNQWFFEPEGQENNWTVISDEGNPAPAAKFSGSPLMTDYNCGIIRAVGAENIQSVRDIQLKFDLSLSGTSTGNMEYMKILFNPRWTGEWKQIDSIPATEDFDWKTFSYDITGLISEYVSGNIMFEAGGENSMAIGSWMLDNIYCYRKQASVDASITASPGSLTQTFIQNNGQDTKEICIGNSGDGNSLLGWSASVHYLSAAKPKVVPEGPEPPKQEFCVNKVESNYGKAKSIMDRESVCLHYDERNTNALGSGGSTFLAAVRFTSNQMAQYTGYALQNVQLCIPQKATTLILKVWDAGTSTSPGELICEQSVDGGIGWLSVNLAEPVEISGSDIWIGCEIGNDPGFCPMGYDESTFSANGQWYSAIGEHWYDGLLGDFNWNIRANIGNETIYNWLSLGDENGVLSSGTSEDIEVHFDATGLENNSYLANICIESNDPEMPVLEIPVSMDILTEVEELGSSFITAYPNPVSGTLYIDMKENVDVLELLDAQGKTIRKYNAEGKSSLIVNVTDVQPGVYLLRFECAKKTVSCKTIIIK